MTAAEPGSPEWWLNRLGTRLDDERPALERLCRYGCGNHDLPEGHKRARAGYLRFVHQSRTNFVGLVADSVLDRLSIVGFRLGNDVDDALAQQVWQANRLDADQTILFNDAVTMRRSYMIVGPAPEPGGVPLITIEDPRMVIHESDPTDRRKVRAALKSWIDDAENAMFAVLYLPNEVHYWRRDKVRDKQGWQRWDHESWERTLDGFEQSGVAPSPTPGIVPVVPFVNRPEKDPMGYGEFEDVIDVQDRINQTILDRLVTGSVGAFRQRWVSGWSPTGPDGQPSQKFDPGADLIWAVNDSTVKFGSFEATDLSPYIDAAKSDVEHLASITRTPPYYLLGTMANISGEALTAAESGLTAKARNRVRQFGEAAEQAMALAFRMMGREAPVDTETIWADVERTNEAVRADSLVKKHSIGVPWQQLMEDAGYTPAQINRMRTQRAGDMMARAIAQPTPPELPEGERGPRAG